MKTILAFLLLAAFPLSAANAPREPMPSVYTPSPCAPDAAAVCQSWSKIRFVSAGAQFRGFSLDRKWVDEHWDEMEAAFQPICARVASCFTGSGNTSTFCLDLARFEFQRPCDRYEPGTRDHDQCSMFATTWLTGLGIKKELHREAQECAAKSPTGEIRHLEAWMVPETIGPDFDGTLRIYAIDAASRIPIRARIASDGPGKFRSKEGPVPTAGALLEWNPRLKRIPNAQGHTDVVAPTFTLQAEGYEPTTVQSPSEIHDMIVTMVPAVSELKTGKNTVTVTARDSVTGEAVEARVMAGHQVAGETNVPFELIVDSERSLPEIWVTSLFDRYSDEVVAPATK